MLLAPIVYFTKPLKTSLWAVWAEQNAHYTQNFRPRPAVPYVKLRAYSPIIYIVPCKDSGMPAFVGPFGLAGVLPGGPPVKINKCFYLTDF